MAIRQYIGARYMPKFMGDYDNTQAYEALSVVDNGIGTSYVSTQPTPAGTPLTNRDYWQVYGSTSGAIINLQNQIDDLREDIERNLLIIGNSYVNKGVCDELKKLFAHSYKKTTDGGGFVTYTAHSVTFETLLDDAIIDTSFDNDTITDIIFVSAAGDPRAYDEGASAYSTAFATNCASIQSKIEANFTNCHRVCLTYAELRDIADNNDAKYSTLYAIHRFFKENADKYNFDYLGWSGFNSMFDSDNVLSDHLHPSDTGAARIGSWIRNAFLGNADYKKFTDRHSINFALCATATVTVLVEFTPDDFNFQVRDISLTNGDSVTISAGDTLLDFSVFDKPIPAPSYYTVDLFGNIFSRGGTSIDWQYVTVTGDSNGIAKVVNNLAPTISVVGFSTICAPHLNNVNYK